MAQSAFYILVYFVVFVSIVKSAPNSYPNSIPSPDELISTSRNSGNGHAHAEVTPEKVPNEEQRIFVEAYQSNLDVRETPEGSQAGKSDGVMDYVLGGVRINWHYAIKYVAYTGPLIKLIFICIIFQIGKLFCCVMCCKTNENEDERLDKRMFPENFDPRDAWPHCSDVISYIRHQGGSAACSIIAATSALSDRLCIASGGQYKKLLSSEDVMRCCKKCPLSDGYNMHYTLEFLKTDGAVSGGGYSSGRGCIPFSFPPVDHEDFKSRGKEIAKCERKCSNVTYSTPYEEDKYFIVGYKIYALPGDTAAIKAELMKRGTCIAAVHVDHEWQFHYKKGSIYSGTDDGKQYTNHAVRLIGWGKENGIEYWLIANSWGKDWGEKGIGKLKKGCCGLGQGEGVWCISPKVPTLY